MHLHSDQIYIRHDTLRSMLVSSKAAWVASIERGRGCPRMGRQHLSVASMLSVWYSLCFTSSWVRSRSIAATAGEVRISSISGSQSFVCDGSKEVDSCSIMECRAAIMPCTYQKAEAQDPITDKYCSLKCG